MYVSKIIFFHYYQLSAIQPTCYNFQYSKPFNQSINYFFNYSSSKSTQIMS